MLVLACPPCSSSAAGVGSGAFAENSGNQAARSWIATGRDLGSTAPRLAGILFQAFLSPWHFLRELIEKTRQDPDIFGQLWRRAPCPRHIRAQLLKTPCGRDLALRPDDSPRQSYARSLNHPAPDLTIHPRRKMRSAIRFALVRGLQKRIDPVVYCRGSKSW